MKQNTTYKQTELGLIPDDWEVNRFTDIAELIHGFQFREEHFAENGRFGVIKIGNLTYQGNISLDNLSKSDCEGINNYERLFLRRGDILMALTGGTLGKMSIFNLEENRYLQNYRVGKFEPNEKSIKNYIYYLLSSTYVQKRIEDNVNEAAQPNFGKQDFDKIKIPLPPLPEQKKIADCLSTWDSAIEKQSALINALTDRKKALMQQLLTGKKRLPGFEGEWKEVKLGDLFEKINRKNEEGNTNVVTISAQRGFVKQTDFFNKSVASETLDNYSLIYHGEFCYNKSYSNGYPLGATKRLIAFEKAVVTTLYICFKIKDQKKSNGSFFEQFFEANSLDRSLIKIAQEGGRAHGLLNVSLSDFFNIKIKLPPIEEQTAIAEILAAADRELQLQKEKLAQLQTQKKGLMQVLLTGKKRLMN